jgi:hypothetical protein
MARIHAIEGIECAPVFLVADHDPHSVSEDDFVSGVPLTDLIERLRPGQRVYLVDYARVPGRTRLTRLAPHPGDD